MKRYLIILTIIFLTIETESLNIELPDQVVINELILIRNTYNWVSSKHIKRDMLRRQSKLVNQYNKHMYLNYLIKEGGGGS